MCSTSSHRFKAHPRLAILFCEFCGLTVTIESQWKHSSTPVSIDGRDTQAPDLKPDESPQTAEDIEATITELLRSSGLKPDDPIMRMNAREVLAEDADDEGDDDPIDIDGKRYYERTVPVDLHDEDLPSAGL